MKLKSNNITEPCQNVISHRIECWNWAAAQGPGKIIKEGNGTEELWKEGVAETELSK